MRKFVRNLFGYRTPLEEVKKVFAPELIFGEEKTAELFNLKKISHPQIDYSIETIKKCEEDNKHGKKFWVLMCRTGMIVPQIQKLLPQEFSPSYLLTQWPKQHMKASKPEYRLVNLKLLEVGKSEVLQEWPTGEKKKVLARARTATVVETVIAAKHFLGKRFLSTGFHAGDTYHNKDGEQIILVGDYDENGLLLTTIPCGLKFPYNNAGIISCRIPRT